MGRSLRPGIYAPLPCFFDENEELDLTSYKKHVQFVAKGGVLPVVSGSMGEAIHLSREERISLIKTARAALDEAGLPDMPIMAGAGAPSTRETIQLARDAAEAGADHVIVVPCGYYNGLLTQDNFKALKQYFVDVAAGSPIPVLLYNFPAVAGGIDMTSDVIEDIARAAPNTCGIKLTCGAVGKLTRVASLTNSASFQHKYPRKDEFSPFLVIDGFIDFLLPSIAAGAAGSITGLGNFAPRVCIKFWEESRASATTSVTDDLRGLQEIVARADWAASKANIPGMKFLLGELFGYGRLPRRPVLPTSEERGRSLTNHPDIVAILDL